MTPAVTVAMPTCDRLGYMQDALDSLVRQEVDFPYEVLVLDNGSDPAVAVHVDELARQTNVSLRYQAVVAKGLHNCRHQAAREARGSILALVDDDIIADPSWLASIAAAFDDPLVHLATGPVVPVYEAEQPEWLDIFWNSTETGGRWCGYLSLLDLGDNLQEIDPRLVFGVNFAIRRQTVFNLGGFNPDSLPWTLRRYRGDGETAIAVAAERRGLKAVYHPGARIHHRVPAERLTVDYFERRAYLQGISDSFTDYRNSVRQGPGNRRVMHSARALVRRLRRWLGDVGRSGKREPSAHQDIRRSVLASRRQGYTYHRRLLETDAGVSKWVKRSDFWDAAVPASGEQVE